MTLLLVLVLALADGGVAARDPAADALSAGKRFYALGDLAEARAALDDALALRPELAEAHLYRALVLAHDGGLGAAAASFQAALALDPTSLAAHRHYAEALLDAGGLPEAELQLEAALALLPPDVPGAGPDEAADTIWLKGELLRRQGRPADAIPWFERHLRLRPGGDGHHALGFIYLEAGDDARARAEFSADLGNDASCEEARQNLAALLQDAGDARGAITHYKLALAAHPGDALTLRGLARAYADTGDDELAIATYRLALEAAPGDREARAGLRAVRRHQRFWIILPWAAPLAALLLVTGAVLGYRALSARRRRRRPAPSTSTSTSKGAPT